MNLAYTTYKLFSTGLFLIFFPVFWLYAVITGRYGKSIGQRLGFYPKSLISGICGSPRIWIHAVSVGEVGAASAIVEAISVLTPDCAFILSTATESGQAFAREKLQSKATVIYAPFDFIPSARKALVTVKPDILVLLETEIWPNWIAEARKLGIPIALVNGRISVRSIRRYLKIRPLMQAALKHVAVFSMISTADAQRIHKIGAPRHRIVTNGNAKYDLLLQQVDEDLKTKMAGLYNLNGNESVFVAGSTRRTEEQIILDVYEKICLSFPETILIIAPRHIERSHDIELMVKKRGFTSQFRTELGRKEGLRTSQVVIVDTIGELPATYSIASIVFCGGSLVQMGGQNIFEAAVWGKAVLYGPSMEDFQDAKDLLDKTGGGIQVADGSDLAEKARYYLNHPKEANRIGRLAKEAVMSHKGAARKHAEVICRLLTDE
ncbi:3-deoxy-D-manno-octulosonic acid transferase [Thermodesulfobacteriota bacterium]